MSAVPEIRPGVKTLWLKKRDCCDVYLLEEHHGWHAPMNLDINFIDSEKKKFTHFARLVPFFRILLQYKQVLLYTFLILAVSSSSIVSFCFRVDVTMALYWALFSPSILTALIHTENSEKVPPLQGHGNPARSLFYSPLCILEKSLETYPGACQVLVWASFKQNFES